MAAEPAPVFFTLSSAAAQQTATNTGAYEGGGGGRWIDPCRGDSAACFPLVAAASDAPSCMEKVPLPPSLRGD